MTTNNFIFHSSYLLCVPPPPPPQRRRETCAGFPTLRVISPNPLPVPFPNLFPWNGGRFVRFFIVSLLKPPPSLLSIFYRGFFILLLLSCFRSFFFPPSCVNIPPVLAEFVYLSTSSLFFVKFPGFPPRRPGVISARSSVSLSLLSK